MIEHIEYGDRKTIHEDAVKKLICELGLKGKTSIKLLMQEMDWHDLHSFQKISFKKTFHENFIPFAICKTRFRRQVLLLGIDRVIMGRGLTDHVIRGKFSAIVSNKYALRLSRGKFPDPNNEYELALEMDLLTRH